MEIFREETAEEKRDFKPILNQQEDIFGKFKEAVEKTYVEYTTKKMPFCARCAKIEFKELVEKKIKNAEESVGYETDITKFKISIPDLSPYGKEDRFEFLRESKAMEQVGKVEGTLQRQVQIGTHKDYRCKVRGCGISIFIEK